MNNLANFVLLIMIYLDNSLGCVAGLDEAGRGCLAGPVVAGAVVINSEKRLNFVNDSKLISHKKRLLIEEDIKKLAQYWSVAEVWEEEIDKLNILQAAIQAMHHAIDLLPVTPDALLVDGNYFKNYPFIPHQCIVKGDQKYACIAAASILAKNHRDRIMLRLHEEFPMYGWDKNMGYATKKHREALMEYGPCKYHRKSFRLEY